MEGKRVWTVAASGLMTEKEARLLANVMSAVVLSADVVVLEGEVRVPHHDYVVGVTELGGLKPKPIEIGRW